MLENHGMEEFEVVENVMWQVPKEITIKIDFWSNIAARVKIFLDLQELGQKTEKRSCVR